MKKKALVILAEGFEEIEAVTAVDILKRAGVEVAIAGVGSLNITGSRAKISISADIEIEDIGHVPDVLVLPGGMPGAENLGASSTVKNLIRTVDSKDKLIAAICATPAIVLAPMGMLDGKEATCYPGMEEHFSSTVKSSKQAVVRDGNIITSRAAGTALEFSLKIVEELLGKDVAEAVSKSVLF